MTVIRPNSISGITSITSHQNDVAFYKSDGTGANINNISIHSPSGIITASSFHGNGANLTGLVSVANQADNRLITATGTTNALNGEANLIFDGTKLGIGGNPDVDFHIKSAAPTIRFTDTDTNRFSQIYAVDGNLRLDADNSNAQADTNISFRTDNSERLRIGSLGQIGIAGANYGTSGQVLTSQGSGSAVAWSTISTQDTLSFRNLIINGAMQVAQRGTSSTSNGYGDLDRWKHEYGSVNENPTFAQVSLTTSDTPYTLGLTKTYKLTNGDQTSGLQAASQINFNQQIEAQNITNSGWNYKSSSSYITLSFWVRSSVPQNFHGFVKTTDGTNYVYPYETGTLSTNTWTKITKSIPGNSNLTIDDNTGAGLQVFPIAIYGTNYTSNSVTNDAWATWASGSRSKDQTATWFTTNDSTLEITGVQLEVGSTATAFEHRSFADELRRCQRYFQKDISTRASWNSGNVSGRQFPVRFITEMRDTPTISFSNFQGAGSLSASAASRQGYNAYMSGTERFYEWRHTATAEI